MFSNIGKKIKTLAEVFCGIGIFFSFILAFYILFNAFSEGEILYVIVALLVGLLGFVAAWLSSMTLYGFGELIDKTTEIANNTRNMNRSYGSSFAKNTSAQPKAPSFQNKICSNCGEVNGANDYHCTNCGAAIK